MLDMAEAKVEAIAKVEMEDIPFSLHNIPDESGKYVEDYVRSNVISENPVSHTFSTSNATLPVATDITATIPHATLPVATDVTATLPNVTRLSDSLPTVTDANATLAHAISTIPDIQRGPLGPSKGLYTPLNPCVDAFVPKPGPLPPPIGTNTHSTWMFPGPIPAPMPTTMPTQFSQVDQNIHLMNFAKSFAEQVNLNRLPLPEPSIFEGDPLKYPGWKSAFESLIDHRGIPYSERVHYLKKYVGGAAKEAIEGYFLLNTSESYEEAKKLLEERYGDQFVVTNAFREKLDDWPRIQARDGLALRKFSDFLRQCETAMTITGGLSILNDNRENRKMLSKLPDWLISRWARIVADWKERGMGFPPFSEFRKYIVKEANIACDPITSLQSFKPVQVNNPRVLKPRNTPGAHSFLTEVSNINDDKCVFCKNLHNIDDCKSFASKKVEECRDFARANGLCFGCLKKGHRVYACRNRLTCKICSKRHPTVLHLELPSFYTKSEVKQTNSKTVQDDLSDDSTLLKGVQTGVSHLNESNGASLSSLVVPVWISHQDEPEREILIYALLDTQSDTTFVLDKTSDSLGIKGSKTKLLLSTMSNKNQLIDTSRVKGLQVRGYDSSLTIPLPTAFTRSGIPVNRSHIPSPQMAEQWPHLNQIADKIMPVSNCDVGLLIGYNCPRALVPREVIPPTDREPYAQRTDLGWGIIGIINPNDIDASDYDLIGVSHRVVTCEVNSPPLSETHGYRNNLQICFNTSIKEVIDPMQITQMMDLEFNEKHTSEACEVPYSQNDLNFVTQLKDGVHQLDDGHYQMPLPFKHQNPHLHNNKSLALHRLNQLKRRLKSDSNYATDYAIFMQDIIEKGYAEKIPDNESHPQEGSINYIPHHGVYHPKKPGKLRVVFDCSAKFKGESLNDKLLTGPNLTNALVGVLSRFRQENIAFICDIEAMFHQFRVNPEHRNYLRFLWWENGDIDIEPSEFRMCVHLFGAGSSPGCANFGLKQIASDYMKEFGADVKHFVHRNFYVDDGLKSVPTVDEATDLILRTQNLCKKGAVRLHKFISNSKAVMLSIPSEDHAKGMKDLDLVHDSLLIERALGVHWCVESDTFRFRITLKDQPLTRRGILSTVSSVYDPLGFVAPVILVGKQILQQMCADGHGWDSPLPDELRSRWQQWRTELFALENLRIRRCFKPSDFGEVKSVELHYFSDASTNGYGQCTYLRLKNDEQQVHCALVMGKARVVPLKPTTVPRLELTAALLSVKIHTLLKKELEYDNVTETFWTDSQVVLGYINNEARRFQVFVANRVQQIRSQTEPTQWRHIRTAENPADEASRGLTPRELVSESKWLTGPDFLWEQDIPQVQAPNQAISPTDPELKKAHSFLSQKSEKSSLEPERLDCFSSWFRAKKAIALCLRLKEKLRDGLKKKTSQSASDSKLSVDELCHAEYEIIKIVQRHAFQEELEVLSCTSSDTENESKRTLKRSSPLYKLNAFLDKDNILRVGGRLTKSDLSYQQKHPVILPRKSHVTDLVIRYFHDKVHHQGRGMTVNEIRSHGYWI